MSAVGDCQDLKRLKIVLGRASFAAAMAAALVFSGFTAPAAAGLPAAPARPYRIFPAEFEPQDAVLLCWDGTNEAVQRTLIQIVAAISSRVQVVMLVRTPADRRTIVGELERNSLPAGCVRFFQVPYDTIWARDYGPTVVWTADGSLQLVDAAYQRGQRPLDDEVPGLLAPELLLPMVRTPLVVDGGNLLTNGIGLCVTSFRVLEQNAPHGLDPTEVEALLCETYGVEDVVFLEPLSGEGTGHVDMFCTFTGPTSVVMGAVSPETDANNAAILDRNAARLEGLATPQGPLTVHRVPMPARDSEAWRTYTNVLYANGALLMPSYSGVDPEIESAAIETYRRLLPDWTIVPIDCDPLISLGGAVHCVSKNLSQLAHAGAQPDLWLGHPHQRLRAPAPAFPESDADQPYGAVDEAGFAPPAPFGRD